MKKENENKITAANRRVNGQCRTLEYFDSIFVQHVCNVVFGPLLGVDRQSWVLSPLRTSPRSVMKTASINIINISITNRCNAGADETRIAIL